MEGSKFGPYIIEKRVGKGAAGVVYRAYEGALDRKVAIKLLSENWVDDAESQKRFLQEARAAAKLDHPGIVRVHKVDMYARPPYMVMEFVDGLSLEGRIQRDGTIPWREALGIVRGTADALAAAHAEGVIHRDVKPGNILLDSDGRPHVTDFGLARLLDAQTRVTIEKVSIGSPAYMSPEQCRGDDVTPASDLFGLGITLFEVLTGRLPFIALTASDVAEKIVSEPIPRLTEVVADLPAPLEQLIDLLTAKDPAQRYPNAHAVIKHIDRLLAPSEPEGAHAVSAAPAPSVSAPTPARRPHPRLQAPPQPAEHPLWKVVAAIATAGILALVITWLLVRSLTRPDPPPDPPPEPQPMEFSGGSAPD